MKWSCPEAADRPTTDRVATYHQTLDKSHQSPSGCRFTTRKRCRIMNMPAGFSAIAAANAARLLCVFPLLDVKVEAGSRVAGDLMASRGLRSGHPSHSKPIGLFSRNSAY